MNIKMKKKELEMTSLEERKASGTWMLATAALVWALSVLSPSEWAAKTVSSIDEGAKVTEVTQRWTEVEGEKKAISLEDAVKLLDDEWWAETEEEDGPWIEPDPGIPTKFSVYTWVGYTVGWDVKWVNRIQWSGEMLSWTKWAIKITWIADLDDPMHSKWSWKVILWKSLYKWITLDWDYTFTWTGWNIFRFGIWYGGQIGKWVYWIKLFPLNTNWSSISAKVFLWTRVWEWWELSSFVLVDFDKKSYYWETEFTQKLAEWIALFVQTRLWWTLDGRFWSWDSQSVLWWVRFDIK